MKKGKILVIDDEYGIRMGIQEILTMEGYDVSTVETGQEALSVLAENDFDVVMIDYRLPDIDGLTLLEAIKKGSKKVMTCMITAYANIDTAIAATRRGIDLFLPKPFSPDDLLGTVETLLENQRLRQDAEKLRLAHEASLLALATEKSQTHSLVESLRDAIMVVNRAGEVALVNRAMAGLLARDEEVLLRKQAAAILAAGPFVPVAQALQELSTGRTVFEIEVDDRQYMVSIARFYGEDGEALGNIVTFSDISAIRRLAMEKSRFIRSMVHEIRSPLGAIKSIVEVFLDKSLGEDVRAYVPLMERAEKRIDAMVELIGDLLSLSQIEVTQQKTPPAQTDVLPLLEEIAELYRDTLHREGLDFELKVEDGLSQVVVNEEDFKTIFTNLVGNAIKYNRPRGSVSLRACLQGPEARFEVTDTGIGIKAVNLPRLFEEFFREKRPETSDITGNGLGLAIVKRLVERNLGRIEVNSKEGEGTTFLVYLPRKQ